MDGNYNGELSKRMMQQYNDLYRMGRVRNATIDEPDDFIVNIVPILAEKEYTTILDAGCGAGRNTRFLGNTGFVVGLDVSPRAIKLASNKAMCKNCRYVIGSFLELPFKDEMFDFAFSTYSIENIALPDIKKALNNLKRTLRKDGLLLVTLHSIKHWRYGQGKVIGYNLFLTEEIIEGKRFRFVTQFFEKEDVERLIQHLNMKTLSIKELVKITDKKRAHWIIYLEN